MQEDHNLRYDIFHLDQLMPLWSHNAVCFYCTSPSLEETDKVRSCSLSIKPCQVVKWSNRASCSLVAAVVSFRPVDSGLAIIGFLSQHVIKMYCDLNACRATMRRTARYAG
jgi:hypothetical protein